MHFAAGKTAVAYAEASHFNSCNTTKINIIMARHFASHICFHREGAGIVYSLLLAESKIFRHNNFQSTFTHRLHIPTLSCTP